MEWLQNLCQKSTGLDGKYWLGWAAECIAGTAPVSSKNMAEQNNYNRPSQSYLRQVYVNFSFGVEPLFKGES